MSRRRPKIAFLTSTDPHDKRAWSGIHHYLARALARNLGDVECLGPVPLRGRILASRARSLLVQLVTGRRLDHEHELPIARAFGRIFEQKLAGRDYDLVFAPAASTEIAFLRTQIPVVYLSDTTFSNMIDYYPEFSRLLGVSIRQGNEIERRAIALASLALYPSRWAAASAVRDYGADPGKVHVLPFGANIEEAPPRERALARSLTPRCRLLLLGVDWTRKGGSIAHAAMLRLNELGIDAMLTVCGCVPPRRFRHPKLRVIPFINKNDPEQYRRFQDLLFESDFLLMPTRADCSPVVFCEASAYGLPSLAANTGGVEGAVRDGENGVLLPADAGGDAYATAIAGLYRDEARYAALVASSRRRYDAELNWDAFATQVGALLARSGLL